LIEALKDPNAKASLIAQAIKYLAEGDALDEPKEPPSPAELLKNLPFPPKHIPETTKPHPRRSLGDDGKSRRTT
jgi:hypothetical protein